MGSSTPEVGGGELGITTGTRCLEDGLTAWAWVEHGFDDRIGLSLRKIGFGFVK